jgi:hypothetical protein
MTIIVRTPADTSQSWDEENSQSGRNGIPFFRRLRRLRGRLRRNYIKVTPSILGEVKTLFMGRIP